MCLLYFYLFNQAMLISAEFCVLGVLGDRYLYKCVIGQEAYFVDRFLNTCCLVIAFVGDTKA